VRTLVALGLTPGWALAKNVAMRTEPDLILHAGRFATMAPSKPHDDPGRDQGRQVCRGRHGLTDFAANGLHDAWPASYPVNRLSF